ncbi:MAG: C-terminal binding protein [Anaerolineae bacterium]|nr:C-terminal binding protein [Candidatus Roseilinea sp.]MDW8448403.1 C-terminal binding protein [Anaerolineae bacterium]
MFKVVHAEADPNAALPIERAALAAVGAELVCAGASDEDALITAARDADLVLSEVMPFSRRTLARLPRCLAVVGYTIGLDHYDLPAATEQGIIIAHTPGFCADEVSNHVVMFILACARRLFPLDRKLRNGWWPDGRRLEAELTPMGSLRGETLGLVGFGRIARLVVDKLAPFGMRICAYDPYVEARLFAQHGVAPVALDDLLRESDYVSLHAPLSPATRGMIGARQLDLMKPGAFLINTSRGALVDEAALVEALRARRIAGAALDVFATEPLPRDHPLLALDNVIVTPHAAYCSDAAYARVRHMAADEAVRVLRGEWPLALANPDVKGRSRMEALRQRSFA